MANPYPEYGICYSIPEPTHARCDRACRAWSQPSACGFPPHRGFLPPPRPRLGQLEKLWFFFSSSLRRTGFPSRAGFSHVFFPGWSGPRDV